MKDSSMKDSSKALYRALKKRYRAKIAESRATLMIYFDSSVGIGDHSTHLEDMDSLVTSLADAEDKLNSLKKNFRYIVYNEDYIGQNEEA